MALLLSVELCSLTFQRDDLSGANIVASGLFGDGAAAAVVVGNERPAAGPSLVDTRSIFYRGTEHVIESIDFDAEVPDHLMTKAALRK